MNRRLNKRRYYSLAILFLGMTIIFTAASCKDDKPEQVPDVQTSIKKEASTPLAPPIIKDEQSPLPRMFLHIYTVRWRIRYITQQRKIRKEVINIIHCKRQSILKRHYVSRGRVFPIQLLYQMGQLILVISRIKILNRPSKL